MMTSSVEDNWPWEFGSHPRRSASGDTKTKKPKVEQETAQPMAAGFNNKNWCKNHSKLFVKLNKCSLYLNLHFINYKAAHEIFLFHSTIFGRIKAPS